MFFYSCCKFVKEIERCTSKSRLRYFHPQKFSLTEYCDNTSLISKNFREKLNFKHLSHCVCENIHFCSEVSSIKSSYSGLNNMCLHFFAHSRDMLYKKDKSHKNLYLGNFNLPCLHYAGSWQHYNLTSTSESSFHMQKYSIFLIVHNFKS